MTLADYLRRLQKLAEEGHGDAIMCWDSTLRRWPLDPPQVRNTTDGKKIVVVND